MKLWFARLSAPDRDADSLLKGAGAACACAYEDWSSFSRDMQAAHRRPPRWRALLAWHRPSRHS